MTPLTSAELDQLTPPRATWGRKLHGLAIRVMEGRAELGVFYRIASFDRAHKAREVVSMLERNPHKCPTIATFALRAQRTVDDEGRARRSELWACVESIDIQHPRESTPT